MNNSAYRKAPGRVSKNYSPNKKKSTIAIFINLNGFSKNIFEITNHQINFVVISQ